MIELLLCPNDTPEALAVRKAALAELRMAVKASRIGYREIARQSDCHESWVGRTLRGDSPEPGMFYVRRIMTGVLRENGFVVPECLIWREWEHQPAISPTPRAARILAILQNQWFKDPDRVRRLYDRYPDRRTAINRQLLFLQSKTGNILTSAFGQELVDAIVWEEASPQIGGHSGAVFPPDRAHIAQAIADHQPDIVLAFGRMAHEGLYLLPAGPLWGKASVSYPHPTARHLKREDIDGWRGQLAAAVPDGLYLLDEGDGGL